MIGNRHVLRELHGLEQRSSTKLLVLQNASVSSAGLELHLNMTKSMYDNFNCRHVEGSVHKGSISRNPNFSGNEFLCFASFTS